MKYHPNGKVPRYTLHFVRNYHYYVTFIDPLVQYFELSVISTLIEDTETRSGFPRI